MLGLELADFQFYRNEARKRAVIEKQINIEILTAYLYPIFLTYKGKIFSEFKNEVFQIIDNSLLEIVFRVGFG